METLLLLVCVGCVTFGALHYLDGREEQYLDDLERRMLAAFNRGEIRTEKQLRQFK